MGSGIPAFYDRYVSLMAANKSSHRQTRLVFFSGFGGLLLLLGVLESARFLSSPRSACGTKRSGMIIWSAIAFCKVSARNIHVRTYIAIFFWTRMRRWPPSTASSFSKPAGKSMKTSLATGCS